MNRGECDKYHDTILKLAKDELVVDISVYLSDAQMCMVGMLKFNGQGYWSLYGYDGHASFSEWQIDDVDVDERKIWLKTKDEV